MLPRLLVMLAVAVLVPAPQNGAAALSQVRRPIRAVSSSVRPAEAALVGTIEKFEQSARELVLRTHEGRHVTFVLAQGAVVRMGSHTLKAADLGTHSGRRAKVRFTESDGTKTAHWVTVSSEAPKSVK